MTFFEYYVYMSQNFNASLKMTNTFFCELGCKNSYVIYAEMSDI